MYHLSYYFCSFQLCFHWPANISSYCIVRTRSTESTMPLAELLSLLSRSWPLTLTRMQVLNCQFSSTSFVGGNNLAAHCLPCLVIDRKLHGRFLGLSSTPSYTSSALYSLSFSILSSQEANRSHHGRDPAACTWIAFCRDDSCVHVQNEHREGKGCL